MIPTYATVIDYGSKSNSELWAIIAQHKKLDALKRRYDNRAFAAYCVLDARTPSKQKFNIKTQ